MKKIFSGVVCCVVFCLLSIGMTWGAEFCVDPGGGGTYTDLQAALTAAMGYPESNTIKVVQGTYTGNFISVAASGYSTTLLGGYTAGCDSRAINPSLTILDGDSSGKVLVVDNVDGGNIWIDGFTIQHGDAASPGAGIFAITSTGAGTAGSITITNNIIRQNSSSNAGGGVYANSGATSSGTAGNIFIMSNIITDNSATNNGGGVQAVSYSNAGTAGKVLFVNNIVTGNSSGNFGGGIAAQSSSNTGVAGTVNLTNNTITGNDADDGGGAALIVSGSSGGIINCYNNIIQGNTATYAKDINLGKGSGSVANGYNNDYADMGMESWTNSGNNINADPRFVGSGDYHLRPSSPCIDTGFNGSPNLPSYDIEGNYRIMDGNYDGKTIVDMGAYEYWSNVQCVTNAEELQSALTAAQSNSEEDTIKVVQGTYSGNFLYSTGEGRGIILLGGYTAGCGTRVVNPENTILEGIHLNLNRVLNLYNYSGDIIVEGFTMRKGEGGGISAESVSSSGQSGTIIITNNIITQNTPADSLSGGGVKVRSHSLSGRTGAILITNNTITENEAQYYGGFYADSFTDSGSSEKIMISNNIITGNTATDNYGGGSASSVSNSGTTGEIFFINNIIAKNTAANSIGGMGAISESTSGTAGTLTFTNNTVTENTANGGPGNYAGGAYLFSVGGGGGGDVNCYNNIFWNNSAYAAGDIYLGSASGTSNFYNNDYGDMSGSWTNSGNNINGDPLFVGGGNYHLIGWPSPCIDRGDNSAPGIALTDFEGDNRIVYGINKLSADIGADEYTFEIILKTPWTGTVFDASTLINKYQPTFQWASLTPPTTPFKNFTLCFSTSADVDYECKTGPITKANVRGTLSSYTPSLGTWKKITTASNNNGGIRDVYLKVVGTWADKNMVPVGNEWRSFKIDDPLAAVIRSPGEGDALSSVTPPTFEFIVNFNVKLRLEISSVSDFSDSKKIKKFTYSVKDPNLTPSLTRTLSSGQWNSIIKLVGSGTGYFRGRSWDGLKRETVSGIREFTISP